MGDILSAINDDMDRYAALCKRFGEEPQYEPDFYGNRLLDCYGEHSKKLELRLRKEQRNVKTPTDNR